MRTQIVIGLVLLVSGVVLTTDAQAQMFIYPEKGQSKDQQELDQFTCHKWAKEQTGIDPNQTSMAAAPAPPPEGGVRRHRRAEMQYEEQEQKASVQRQQQQQEFNRAYGVCLEGKGYKVG